MTMTDPIADMLTRIRNCQMVGKETVSMPASKVKNSILAVMKDCLLYTSDAADE